MSELVALLDDRDKLLLGNEIEKLFVLQDRPLAKDKKAILVDEISRSGLPIEALLSGLRKLMNEDLKTIKKSTILEAAEDFIVNITPHANCEHCSEGMIIAKDEKGRFFSLACNCAAGRRQKLAKWLGEKTQLLPERDFYVGGVKHTLESRLVTIQTPI